MTDLGDPTGFKARLLPRVTDRDPEIGAWLSAKRLAALSFLGRAIAALDADPAARAAAALGRPETTREREDRTR